MSVGIVASIAYGVVHDQITIRICPDYFLYWHPPLTESQDLTYVALLWGVVATWWVGAIFGLLLGIAAYAGRMPPAPFGFIRRAILWIFICSGACAAVAGAFVGATGFVFTDFYGDPVYGQSLRVQRSFSIDLAAHSTSYAASALGGVVALVWIVICRRRLAAAGAV